MNHERSNGSQKPGGLWAHRVGSHHPDRLRVTLEWRDEAIERWGRGSRALTVGLLLGSTVGPRDLRAPAYFENILNRKSVV